MSFDFFAPAPQAEPFVNHELMPDVMIDLETMGTRPNAPMLSIGAVAFDNFRLVKGKSFYINVSLQDSMHLGAQADPDTIMWWMTQSDDARAALVASEPVLVVQALVAFDKFLAENCVVGDKVKVWGCSPAFDCNILREHYIRCGLVEPWKFWNERDYRTVRTMFNVVQPAERHGHHNAAMDADYQVEHLFAIRRHLREKGL